MKSQVTRTFKGALFASLVSCAIIDDYGPPARWTIVTGRVTLQNGSAVAGIEVALTRCDDPIGFLGEAVTNLAGEYRIEGGLPPRGVLPSLDFDTLQVQCRAILGRDGERDSLTLRFGPERATAPLHVLNLEFASQQP